jgi:hypothetical protein
LEMFRWCGSLELFRWCGHLLYVFHFIYDIHVTNYKSLTFCFIVDNCGSK